MKYLKGFVLGLAIVVGVQFVSAAWTDPSATPPGNNTDTPINVGLSQQDKLGSLFLNTDTSNPYAIGLGVFGKSVFNGSVQIVDGTQHAGYILVSTDAQGNAAWTSTSSLGITGGGTGGASGTNGANGYNGGFRNFKVYNSSGSFTVPDGINTIMAEAVGGGGAGICNYLTGAASANGTISCISGSAGGYGRSIFTVTPGQVITVTVGGGGGESDAYGSPSSFLSLTSNGGDRGTYGNSGGTSNGQLSITGGSGVGVLTTGANPSGAATAQGGAAAESSSNGPGAGGSPYARSYPQPQANTSGNGGIVTVWW